jgi:hypothetical protein
MSEMDGPNIRIYPDTNQIGVFDAGQRANGGWHLFNVDDALADYGGLGRRRVARSPDDIAPVDSTRRVLHDRQPLTRRG